MMSYTLKCSVGHEFEGWFRSSAAFEDQAAKGLLSCPVCGDTGIARAPMAPAVVSGRKRDQRAEAAQKQAEQAKMMAVLKDMRRKIESDCDYVGPRFAEEARKIHYGETEARGIYGEASAEETSALQEEGIEIARIPWVPLDN